MSWLVLLQDSCLRPSRQRETKEGTCFRVILLPSCASSGSPPLHTAWLTALFAGLLSLTLVRLQPKDAHVLALLSRAMHSLLGWRQAMCLVS